MAEATVSFVRIGSNARDGRARYALLLAFLVAFGVYKACLIGLGRAGELWLGWAFDASFWSLCWLISELVAGRRVLGRERAAGALLYPLLYASGALVFAHTWFYDAAIERRLTALDVSLGGISAFFHELPTRGYLALAGLLVGLHALAFVLSNTVDRPRLPRALVTVTALCAASAISSLRAPRTPSVLFDTSYESWQLASLPRVRATPVARNVQLRNALDKSALAVLPTPRFEKVIVLVMETMTSERLARERSELDARSFFRTSEHVHSYTRYFSNNQDSRTGMLNMLMARVIPYEAYGEADREAYAGVARMESLVDRMRLLGFRSAFALSQVAPEDVVRDLKWDELLHLGEEEIPELVEKYLCIAPDVWENGCEDLALIPRLVDFLAKSERAFVYQELIWGHASEYNELSGKSNAAYYSGYVDTLIAALARRGLLDESLIAITSDHGYRDKGRQGELGAYQIPLWFYASRFVARSDARLLSHVDFKDLLFDELSESSAFSTPNPNVLIVGSTGSGMLTAISERGGFTLMKERAGARLLMAWRPSGQAGELSPGQISYLFEHYRERFDRALRAAR